MFTILLLLVPFAACQEVEFSTRPNNVSILLLYFTHRSTETATVLSPFGLWSLMAGICYGASGNTYKEIFRALLLYSDKKRFNTGYKTLIDTVFKTPTSGVSASNKNFIFIDSNFNELVERDFREFLTENFDSSVVYFDFDNLRATAERANTLIRIRSPPVTNVYTIEDFRGSSLMMSNIVYFQGVWSLPFNKSNTRLAPNRDNKIYTEMYQRAKVPYSHLDLMKASVMELAYGNDGKYCMLVITPDPNVPLMTVYTKFEKITFRNILDKLQSDVNEFGLKEVDIRLPRFRKSSYQYLKKPLNDMGIYEAFDASTAEFPFIARLPIYIDTIEQKSDLYITESGTVAYASTPGRGNNQQTAKEDTLPSNMLMFILEKSTTTVLFGGIFP